LDFNAEPIGRYVRIVSIIALLLGLNDAARLLGVSLGAESPITALGVSAFVYLAIFTLALLFAAVGLWIKASWGAVLLVGATTVEIVMFLVGNHDVEMSVYGFAVRLILLAAIVGIVVLSIVMRRAAAAHD
jgi:hypothetical protein